MNRSERLFMATSLIVIIAFVVFDLATDSRDGISWWHLLMETAVAFIAMTGVFFLIRGSFTLKRSLESEKKISSKLREEAKHWQEHSRKYTEGLSQAIDEQLEAWKLTTSEKEVAFLLLKGLSLKEIAEIRDTTEKTTRTHATAIYTKSGLTGRSELAAFFLEDLLVPTNKSLSV